MDFSYTSLARTAMNLLEPVVLLWLGLIALTLVLWRKRERGLAAATGFAAAAMWIFCGTPLTIWLMESLERPYAGIKPEQLPTADVIVMLGGGVEPSVNEVGNLHFTTGGDRVPMALELARLGKAPVLCVSGGQAKFGRYRFVEADLVAKAITERGLSRAEVVSFGGCSDTHDEALRLRQFAHARGWKSVLLVTSAYHMRRAVATFRAEGFEVIPVACNFLTKLDIEARPPPYALPNALAFTLYTIWIHEKIGWLEYKRRGWIRE